MTLVICAYEPCGRMFERGPRPRRFCCEACRRAYQNAVRREARAEERAEERAAREAGRPMMDPWARCDIDEWTAEEIWKNALLDPAPVDDYLCRTCQHGYASLKKGATMGDFDKAHAFTSRWEGGFAKHPSDPGGATKYGVSLRFLREQGLDTGDVDKDGDIDEEDIRALTPALAARVLRRNFWDVFPLDNVQPLCATVIYDTAVNMGVFYARKMAQQALGLQADGRWGPLTWAALKSCDDRKTAVAMCHIRRARYHELTNMNKALKAFLKGWLRRVDELEKEVEK